jgi:Skp family chaperone for outer membrane proteins
MEEMIKKKALQSMGGNASYKVAQSGNDEEKAASAPTEKSKAFDEGGWGDALVKSLVALAPVGIGAAAGGAQGVVAGAKAADTVFKSFDDQKKARADAAAAKEEKDYKSKTMSLAERKQAEEERKNRQDAYLKQLEIQAKGKDALPKLKTMASEQINTLAESGTADTMLADLEATLANPETESLIGPIAGRLSQVNPLSTEGKALSAKMLAATQMIGRSLEGRGLTEPDFEKYQKIFPSMTDRPDVARAKLAQIKKSLESRKNETLKTLEQSGYDTSGFPATPPPQAVARAATGSATEKLVGAMGPKSANAGQAAPDFSSMSEEQLKKYLGH